MDSFALCPLQDAYKPQPGNGVIEQALMGGFARQRVGFINNSHMVNASVLLKSKAHAQYFWAFWRKYNSNPQPFLWRLMIDDVEMTTYQCQFVFESLQVGSRNGVVYPVSFTVRCKPKPANVEFDQAIIDIWVGGNGLDIINLLERLVNVDMPNALGEI